MAQNTKPVHRSAPPGTNVTRSTNAFCFIVSDINGLNVRDRPNTDSTAIAQLQQGDSLQASCNGSITGGSYTSCGGGDQWVPVHYDDRNADAYVALACVGYFCDPCP
jgi:hypothetical protein